MRKSGKRLTKSSAENEAIPDLLVSIGRKNLSAYSTGRTIAAKAGPGAGLVVYLHAGSLAIMEGAAKLVVTVALQAVVL